MASGSTCPLLSPSPWLLTTPLIPKPHLIPPSIPPISMASRARKLLLVPEHDPIIIPSSPVSSSHSGILSSTLSPTLRNKNNEDYYISSSYGGGFGSYRLNPPLDASMALTILVLLIALFFMGFFSVYIRRFSHDSSVRHRRFADTSPPTKGADPCTVDSLPAYTYNGATKKKQEEIDCAICLSEFEEGEVVKTIPYCGHVFHVQCIDTWLGCHVTCPLCRTARLFPAKELVPRVVIRCDADVGGLGSAVDGRNTWREEDEGVGPGGLRRSSSCLVSGQRAVWLRRSLSI